MILLTVGIFWRYSQSFAALLKQCSVEHSNLVNNKIAIQLVEGDSTCLSQFVVKQYTILRELSIMINSAIGAQITWNLLEFVFYYSVSLDDLFEIRNLDKNMIIFLFWMVDTFSILYFASDAWRQV